MASRALRRFVHGATLTFHGGYSFNTIANRWRRSITELSHSSRTLASHFGSLPIRPIVDSAESGALIGNMEGRRFTRLLRTARSIEAIEGATGTSLSRSAKRAFRSFDDTMIKTFPDSRIERRNAYVQNERTRAVQRGALRENDVVTSAKQLEIIIRNDAALTAQANKLSKHISKTKKLLFLGGVIAVTGVGISYLCKIAAEHAARNTGCFMYTSDGVSITKCRIEGCSCPVRLYSDVRSCHEDILWHKMRLRENECDKGGNEKDSSYCVHCNWNETNRDSVHYVDREYLPDTAYVACEKQDAMGAMFEIVGGTLDRAWSTGTDLTRGVSDSLSKILQYLPYVIAIVGLIIFLSIVTYIIRMYRSVRISTFQR